MKPTQYILKTPAFGLKPGTLFSLSDVTLKYWTGMGAVELERRIVEDNPEHFKRVAPDFEALLTVFGQFQKVMNVPLNAPEFYLPLGNDDLVNDMLIERHIPDTVRNKRAVFRNTYNEDGWGRPIYEFTSIVE